MSKKNYSADDILREIRRIVRRVSLYSKQLNQDVGLTVPQLLNLKAIGRFEEEGDSEITIANLSRAVQLSSATVSRIVDRLVKAGYVLRSRSEIDRRKLSLSLSKKGWAQYRRLPNSLQDSFVEQWEKLEATERRELVRALKRIASLMHADSVDAAPMLTPEDDVREAQRGARITRGRT